MLGWTNYGKNTSKLQCPPLVIGGNRCRVKGEADHLDLLRISNLLATEHRKTMSCASRTLSKVVFVFCTNRLSEPQPSYGLKL
jgi:hypothetical protein